MDTKEILFEMELDYSHLVNYLLEKHGAAEYDYFTDTSCQVRNKKISKTNKGLFCHHIDEDKGCNLSNSGFAEAYPFEYQKADRLVYCNYIEHLLLHIQIGKDRYWKEHEQLIAPRDFSLFIVPGVMFICSEINELYAKGRGFYKWQNKCFEKIRKNFDDYVFVLNSFVNYIVSHYAGSKTQKGIYLGKHLKHKELGDGIIIKIDGDDIFSFVTIKFSECEKIAMRYDIDIGGYEENLEHVKNKLSSNKRNEVIKLVYDKLEVFE